LAEELVECHMALVDVVAVLVDHDREPTGVADAGDLGVFVGDVSFRVWAWLATSGDGSKREGGHGDLRSVVMILINHD